MAGKSDIGLMSRDFKYTGATEAIGSNPFYTQTCVTGGTKITQISVALDAITIVAKVNGLLPAASRPW